MGIYYLNDDDRAWLRGEVKRQRAESEEKLDGDRTKDQGANPEVYLLKLPATGIPKCEGVEVGRGFCEVQRITYSEVWLDTPGTTVTNITPVKGPDAVAFVVPVCNPYPRPWFAFSTYILAVRDAYGMFVCQPPPTQYRAGLVANLVQGGASTAQVFYRDSGAWADSGEVVDVVEFVLNTDEMFVAKQKGEITWDEGGVWVFDSGVCPVPDDTGLIT